MGQEEANNTALLQLPFHQAPITLYRQLAYKRNGEAFPVEISIYSNTSNSNSGNGNDNGNKNNTTKSNKLYTILIRDTSSDATDYPAGVLSKVTMHALPIPFFTMNMTGVMELVNESFAKLLRSSIAELRGRNIKMWMSSVYDMHGQDE